MKERFDIVLTPFNASLWSRDRLWFLQIIVFGCRLLSGLFVIAAFVILAAYLDGVIESIIPFVFLATSSVSMLITGEILDVLCAITENTKAATADFFAAQYNIDNLQRNVVSLQRNVESLEQNVEEMCTSLSEITDSLRKPSVPL